MGRERLAIIVLILFFAPGLLPMAGGDSGDPDFRVAELTITAGGAVDNSDGITLAPGEHTISFKVENVGTLETNCEVQIFHWTSWDPANPDGTGSTKTTVGSAVQLSNIAAGGTSISYTVDWIAIMPASPSTQRISAVITSDLDINPYNDVESFEFKVSNLADAEVVTDDLPESGDRIAKASNTDFHVTVLNTGVVAVMARLEVTLTEVDEPFGSVPFVTDPGVQLQPGTLASPAQGVVLTTTVIPGSALVGDYIVDSKVLFTGGGEPPFEHVFPQVETLSISDYIAELIVPANRAIEPGSTTLALFSIKNTGLSPDTYKVTVSDPEGWASVGGFPFDVGPVASGGGYGYFDVTVTIPNDVTLRGTSTLVTATVESENTEAPFILTGGVTIVVGDKYKGVLSALTDDKTIFPDVPKNVIFTLTNVGNSPTGFTITAGLSSPAENWDIDVQSSLIPTLNPADIPTSGDPAGTAAVTIEVTPPALTNPLDPAHKLLAGSTIKMWVMVMPVEGGEPTITTFDFAMQPTITVNPALDHSEILLTEQEVIDGVGAGGFQHVVDLDISVLHNLWTSDHLDNSINAAFTIGTVEFTPKTSGGGVYETVRWSASVSPTLTSLFPGDTTVGTLSILGPNDQMPLAGTLTIPVVSTPVENSMLAFHSTVEPKEVSHDFIVHIPEVSGVVINQPDSLDVESGTDTILTLDFENTGNDKGNYSLSIGHGIPDDWVVTFDASSGVTAGGTGGTGGTVTTVYAINDLSAEMEAHPLEDGRHQTTFDITVYASPDTLADTLQEIPIRVLNTETGLYILDYVVTVRIQERVDMIVEAEDDGLVSLSVDETPFTRIKIHNTGNVLTSYHVSLDDSEAGGITFSIETPEDMLIAAGFNDSIKLRLVPDSDASADIEHKVTVWVSTDTGLTASAEIIASIIADHQLSAVVDPLTYIVPGETAEVTIALVNSGNLVMNVVPIVTIDDGWTVSIIPTSVTLMTGQSMDFTATVTAPPLDGTDSMQDGDMHTITVVFVDGDGTTRAIGTGTLVVSAIFDLVATGWDDTAQFMRMTPHTFSPVLTNTGNTDLLVDLTYEITDPSGAPSALWQMDGGAPSSISLARDSAIEISFSVSAIQPEPSVNDIAFLKLSIDPQDLNVTGSASISSTLVMSRLFDQVVKINASELSSDSPISQTVFWSHIPSGGSTAAEYKLEYCGAQRTRFVEPGDDDQNWTFKMTAVTDTLEMDLAETACTGTRITLPSADAYDINSLTFKITTPVWPHIYSGDGWNMTFRLYHPNEHDDYTVYHQAVISFILKNSAELSVSNVKLTLSDNRDYLIEGTLDTGSVILRNEGTAMALLVTVTMDCGNNVIVKPRLSYPIPTMNPMDEQIHTFDLTPDRLDWWDDSSEVTCTATVESESAENDLADNVASKSGTVQSWSPNTLYVFVGLVAMIFVSLACLRLGLRNEKFKLMASYAGVITLGLAFHMGTWVWFGPVITFFVIMWMIGVAWRSGDEFQLIHEDYQRARRGQSTIYREHHAELHAVRRQLTFILSMPILGYAAIILGFPPQMEIDVTNIVTLVAMLIIPMYVIRRMLKWMDATYAELYGNLTDTEIALDRIDRELSDPARLIRRLARYGLDDEEYDEDGAGAGESFGDGTESPSGLPVPLMADEGGAAGA